MTIPLKLQFFIVFLILAVVIGWIIRSLVKRKNGLDSRCNGCSLAENCAKSEKRFVSKRRVIDKAGSQAGNKCERDRK